MSLSPMWKPQSWNGLAVQHGQPCLLEFHQESVAINGSVRDMEEIRLVNESLKEGTMLHGFQKTKYLTFLNIIITERN